MSILLDTNVISELVRAQPDRNVVAWVDSLPSNAFYLSVLSLGEIRKGVEKLDRGRRRERLINWLEHDLPDWFGNHILAVDTLVADRWGVLNARVGRSVPAIGSLLAATALAYGLQLATRNVDDFDFPDLPVVNPWKERGLSHDY